MSRVAITGLGMTSRLGLTLSENWNHICGKIISSSQPNLRELISSDFSESFMKLTSSFHSTLLITTAIEVLNNGHYFPSSPSEKSAFAISESLALANPSVPYLKSGAFTSFNMSSALNLNGPVTLSSTGVQAIIEACQLIRNNEATLALAIGASSLDSSAGSLTQSEGSAGILLENLDHAKSRGARIYAEIESHTHTEADSFVPLSLNSELVVSSRLDDRFLECEEKWTDKSSRLSFSDSFGWVPNAHGINDTVIASLIISQKIVPPQLNGKIQQREVGKVAVLSFGLDDSAWVLELGKVDK